MTGAPLIGDGFPVRPSVAIAAALVLATAPGCRGHGQEAAADCPEAAGGASPEAGAGRLAGEYALTMVATRGPEAGARAEGRLVLLAYGEGESPPAFGADTTVRAPLYGAVEVELAAVGADAPGSLASRDPERPGVLVFERRDGAPEEGLARIFLRLGSTANDPDLRLVEGSYTVLEVREVEEGRFVGTWRSGAREVFAAGRFCAVRAGG